jgi:hypothetical protein
MACGWSMKSDDETTPITGAISKRTHHSMTAVDQLRLFVHRADELRQTRLVRTSGLNCDFSFHFDQKSFAYTFPLIDEDDLRSFLLTFRQFVMPGEPVFIRRVHNIACQHITSDELRAAMRGAGKAWSGTLRSCGFALNIHGRAITPEHVLDLYINGHYFHTDEQKRAELNGYGMPDRLLVKTQLLNFLVRATMAIVHTRHILRAALCDGAVS